MQTIAKFILTANPLYSNNWHKDSRQQFKKKWIRRAITEGKRKIPTPKRLIYCNLREYCAISLWWRSLSRLGKVLNKKKQSMPTQMIELRCRWLVLILFFIKMGWYTTWKIKLPMHVLQSCPDTTIEPNLLTCTGAPSSTPPPLTHLSVGTNWDPDVSFSWWCTRPNDVIQRRKLW